MFTMLNGVFFMQHFLYVELRKAAKKSANEKIINLKSHQRTGRRLSLCYVHTLGFVSKLIKIIFHFFRDQ